MGLFDWLFGKRPASNRDRYMSVVRGDDEHQMQQDGKLRLGAQMKSKASGLSSKVSDLRDDAERQMEQEGKTSLGGEDEQLAQKLVGLVQRFNVLYGTDRSEADKVQEEIKTIGQHLCSNGGDKRMKRIAYRVATLGIGKRVRIRDLELHWEGICGWRY